MTHRFDPKNMSRLDDPERKKHLPPDEILRRLGLKKGATFLDIGAGTGYFSFPASVIVGNEGKVVSIDVAKEMTDELSKRVRSSGTLNISAITTGEYETGVEPHTADIVFFCNVIHEVEDKSRLLTEVKKAMKPGGRIGIVEWKKTATPMGPPVSERITADEMVSLLKSSGFTSIRTSDVHGTYDLYIAMNGK
jgi:ubiquinone/menaquinone biosynthesis C-methylase UbiE